MQHSEFESLIAAQAAAEALARTTPKPWWLSKGVWGPVIVVIAQGLKMAGHDFDVAGAVNASLDIITILGAALGWWGRVSATAPIDVGRVAPGIAVEKVDSDFGHFGPH